MNYLSEISSRPGHVKPGTQSDHISAIWDMLPTFCEAADAPTPKDIDGISMIPAFTGGEQVKHDYLYWEFSSKGGQQAVRIHGTMSAHSYSIQYQYSRIPP